MHSDLPDHFIEAAQAALPVLGAAAIGQIGYDIAQGVSPDGIVADYTGPKAKAAAGELTEIIEEGVSWDAAGCYLMGLADGYRAARVSRR